MALLACLAGASGAGVTETARPAPTGTLQPATPTRPHRTAGVSPTVPPRREEAILILEPGPASRALSPLHIVGMADPTFEQTLMARLVLEDGSVLVEQPLLIKADIGQRGPFEADIPFNLSGERGALLQVYSTSPRDGGMLHLASVGLRLSDEGPEQINPWEPRPEALQLYRPLPGETISGGVVQVEGFGLASFEGTLVLEVRDASGELVGSESIIVKAPEMGVPGPFNVELTYEVSEIGPGRVLVIDPLPAFNGLGHITSVDVTLQP